MLSAPCLSQVSRQQTGHEISHEVAVAQVLPLGYQLFAGSGSLQLRVARVRSSCLLQPFLYIGAAVHHPSAKFERRRAALSHGAPAPR
jgi:hypothetical protein